eukprot:CAMPEP_0174978872 /NCGR_PEP_ID=MMETSP0004_2-20121128/14454_1 /TAXON_ID=420556 /ORGANISM="Ochromonas sp., Strain CCMP1393" /LENGTH=89 /DNA_ID=CAMNT_0016230311 /DNA_START=86 /DNA_END=352 /DNA_ORIENTATION=+
MLRDIVSLCHRFDIPVVVDEAHGAHLRFIDDNTVFEDALSCGADIVIQSTHKTLTSFSQTAMMHLNHPPPLPPPPPPPPVTALGEPTPT